MRPVIGVMGSGERGDTALETQARELGAAIAREGWVLLNGGRATGIMDASAAGAHAEGGLVIGVLPDETSMSASQHLDVGIRTGMGDGRNYINVLTSDVVIALKGGPGTLSEVALALKVGRTVVLLGFDPGPSVERLRLTGRLLEAADVDEAISLVRQTLAKARAR